MTPKERAERAATALWEQDSASRWLGMEIESVDEGVAVLTLIVQPHHANGHGICHGGITYALADSAFAVACNSRNQSTVAQHNSISYIAPAKLGDVLRAHARELSLSGRNGIYDVIVSNQHGERIAFFRGCSRSIRGRLFDEEDNTA